MKDETRKNYVMAALIIPFACFAGFMVAASAGPWWTEAIAGPVTLLGIVGSAACLIVGRGHWSLYFALAVGWYVYLEMILMPVMNAQYE